MEKETIKVLMPGRRPVLVEFASGETLEEMVARINDGVEFPIDRAGEVKMNGFRADPESVLLAGDIIIATPPIGYTNHADQWGEPGQWREAA